MEKNQKESLKLQKEKEKNQKLMSEEYEKRLKQSKERIKENRQKIIESIEKKRQYTEALYNKLMGDREQKIKEQKAFNLERKKNMQRRLIEEKQNREEIY